MVSKLSQILENFIMTHAILPGTTDVEKVTVTPSVTLDTAIIMDIVLNHKTKDLSLVNVQYSPAQKVTV